MLQFVFEWVKKGRKKLSEIEKAQVLTKEEHNISVTQIAADLKVSRQAAHKLMKTAKGLQKGTVKKQILQENNICSGKKRKTSGRTDRLLKQDVLASPSITAAILNEKASRASERGFNLDNPKSTEKRLGPPL